jgi:hypothetical protein
MCREFRSLPESGGVMDQDSLIVYGMTAVLEAMQEKEERESKKTKTR